jgi:hypothetical protein
MATSTKTEDYMGRALINASPGVTNPVKDYMGRVTSSTADYNGVGLLDDLASSLAGVVTDSADASPIEGATVSASGRSATTNADGEYTLTGLPSGIYTVTASADGYYTATVEGVVVDSNDDVADIGLQLVAV